ncbi:class I SAM-dependent methyltransferase [Prochlorococcus marinus]|uniref:Class I SAM-dependent methyltransferase n=1 Tax=Prochlorococcus marinus XMU1408 TaxID=2213228 RepID=A0A318R0K1_PROMR|nr:class I SAM-dependent methyltransferase [Prochlorococcus marinus]MBW3041686.1 class I SAM-dependent methyltransferase [Prochlorococcus marinus str. XMU1408]PYE02836.1 class I SAM-dependent methyltransferase [Prochlorococcus marinus XMU1408]
MNRTPEPELMKIPSQVRAYADADFSRSDSMVVKGLEKYLKKIGKTLNKNDLILDVGCGPGNICERIAKNWPFVKVVGIDGSKEMLNEAEKKLCKSFSNNLTYELIEINSIATGEKKFELKADVLVSNSALHHFHDPCRFWNALKKIGKENCIHIHRDLIRPSSLEKAFELKEKYLSNSPEILKKDFYASLKASFTVEEVNQQLVNAGLSQLEVFQVDELYFEIIGCI